MTIEDEILQYLHYHPLSNRVEITLGITNPPSGRIVKSKRLSKYIFYSSFSLLTFATKK